MRRKLYRGHLYINIYTQGFLRCFRDPIQVPGIENQVPRIRENYQCAQNTSNYMKFSRKCFGSLQVHTGYLTFSLKKTWYIYTFLRRFRDPIRVPRIRENYHRVPKIRENLVPRIREIGSLQIQTGFLIFSLKKALIYLTVFIFRCPPLWI